MTTSKTAKIAVWVKVEGTEFDALGRMVEFFHKRDASYPHFVPQPKKMPCKNRIQFIKSFAYQQLLKIETLTLLLLPNRLPVIRQAGRQLHDPP